MNKSTYIGILLTAIMSIVFSLVFMFQNEENNKDNKFIYKATFISNIVSNSFNEFDEKSYPHKYMNNTLSSILNDNNIESIYFSKNENFDSKTQKNTINNEKMTYEVLNNKVSFSLPLNAQGNSSAKCMQCHNISHGDNIGTLSLVLNIQESRGINSNYYILGIIIFATLIILFLSNKAIKENSLLFKRFAKSLNSALHGKYKKIESTSQELEDDTAVVVENYNKLIGDFEQTSLHIDKNLKGFVGVNNSKKFNSPLEESKSIISNLSDIYQFKKQIELDNSIEEIFNRISEIFINQYNLKNFNFIEINNATNKIKVLKEHGDCFYCGNDIKADPSLCRASRTNSDVISIDYHHSCPHFSDKSRFHYCITQSIFKDINLIVNFVFDSKEELEELKNKISLIKSYIYESIPSIEVKFLMDALQESAYVDGLTGLYNRKFLEVEMKKLIPIAKREEFNIGVLLLDMDHFKAVNDEYGHDIGDKVLKELASIIDESVRESDIAVRYGGEEFLILLVNVISEEKAREIADKIRVKVSEREIDVYAGSKLRKTVSIGLSMYPLDSSNIDGVVKNADIALYEAKSNGRNKVVRFSKEQVSSVDLF
jgi:diguanylate cyclase (GGDEF)-like protein